MTDTKSCGKVSKTRRITIEKRTQDVNVYPPGYKWTCCGCGKVLGEPVDGVLIGVRKCQRCKTRQTHY